MSPVVYCDLTYVDNDCSSLYFHVREIRLLELELKGMVTERVIGKCCSILAFRGVVDFLPVP